MQRRAAVAFAQWVVLTLAWLVLADSSDAVDVVAGILAAGLAALAMSAVELQRLAHIALLPRAFAQAWRLPKLVFTGTWEIVKVLARQLFSRDPAGSMLLATPFSAVGDDDRAATKRALATTYTSVAPNFVIVDIDVERGLLFFHQLDESETPKMTLELGAEA